MKFKYAVIEWLDHSSGASGKWRDVEEDINRHRLMKCISSGIVLKETKDFITLAVTLGGLNDVSLSYAGDMNIAKKLITKKKVFNWEVKGV